MGLLLRLVVEAEGQECTQGNLLAAVARATSRTANPPGVSVKKRKMSANAKARRFPRPNGYLVYLAEAAGREHSQADLLLTRATSHTASAARARTKNDKLIQFALNC